MAFQAAVLFALAAAAGAAAQTSSKEQFDDLSRRAQAALDGHPDQAIALYKQALAVRPDWPEGWLYMGGALYESNHYAEATDALRKGLDLAPVFANGWALLGLAESQLDDPDQSLADIRKGEQLGLNGNVPFETTVRVRAAQLLIKSSGFDEALAQLQPLAKYPNEPKAVEETMGLVALASPVDLAAVSPERRAVVDLAGKAAWAFASQHADAASAGFRQLVAQYPTQPGVHYAFGLFLMETDVNSALSEFQKEVQTDPQHWPALLAMASLQLHQGAPDKAIETVHLAEKSVPPKYRWLCHLYLGRAALDGKHVDTATSELRSAARQMSANPSVHFFLAEAYREGGLTADADQEKTEFEKAKTQQDALGMPVLHPFGIQDKH
jgi:predicted Zn-dependent protease